MSRGPRAIVDFHWSETSGVDHPANEEEGWLVMKQRFDGDLDALVAREEERIEKDMALLRYLQNMDLGDAPEEVQAALRTLIDWLESEYSELDMSVAKERWSTAYINDLPDSAFAIHSDGIRALPHHDKSGRPDSAHVRNALARLNQVEGVSDAVRERARAHLIAHAKELGIEVAKAEVPWGFAGKLIARVFKALLASPPPARTPNAAAIVQAYRAAWPAFCADLAQAITGETAVRKAAALDAVDRLQAAVLQTLTTEEITMHEELAQALETLGNELKETIAKALQPAAAADPPAAPATPAAPDPGDLAQTIAKAAVGAVASAPAPIHTRFEEEIAEIAKGVDTLAVTVDRLVAATAVRKSVVGQDDDDEEEDPVAKSKFGQAYRSITKTGRVVLT